MASLMTPGEYFRVSREFGFGARQEVTLLGLLLGATAFEGIGIGMLLPIIEISQTDGDAMALRSESAMWDKLFSVFGSIGAPVTLVTLIAASVCAIVGRQVFSYVRQIYLTSIRQKLNYDVRNVTFERYLRADASYHDEERPGQLVNNLMTELTLSVEAILAPVKIVNYAVFGYILHQHTARALGAGDVSGTRRHRRRRRHNVEHAPKNECKRKGGVIRQ